MKTGIKLDQVTDSNLLPMGLKRKSDFIKNGIYKITSDDIEGIFQEIRCREALEHVEEYNVTSDDEINSYVDVENNEEISDESGDGNNDDNVC